MSWTKQFDINTSASGDRVNNGFAKYESERDYIYSLLNRVRNLDFGDTEPTDRVAGCFWADTSSGYLKVRNESNSDWIALGKLSNEMGHVVGLGNVTAIENGTSAPTASRSGRIFLDTTNGNLYYDTGTLVSIIATKQWNSLVGKPTTLAGFGITDAVNISDIVTTPAANKILKLNGEGILPASITGNAATTTKLATSRTISISKDATGSATFDGSENASIAVTLANSGATAGTYKSVTVDAKGRVTGGSNPTTLSGYGITDAVSATGTAAAATKLATARTISLSGDATGSATFDGTTNAPIAVTLANSGVGTGTYLSPNLIIDAKGRITAASQGSAGFSVATFPAGGVLASAMFVIPYFCALSTIDIKSTKKDSIAAVTPSASTTISIYKNGSSYYSKPITAASTTDTTASLTFAAGDTVQILQSAVNSTEVVTLTARGVRA